MAPKVAVPGGDGSRDALEPSGQADMAAWAARGHPGVAVCEPVVMATVWGHQAAVGRQGVVAAGARQDEHPGASD